MIEGSCLRDGLWLSSGLTSGGGSGGDDEIIVMAHDPSNSGGQPFGKQRTSAMWSPAGDTYSPNSGIWQSVWIESVPTARIESLKMAPNSTHLILNVLTTIPPVSESVTVTVTKHGKTVATGTGEARRRRPPPEHNDN